MELFALEMILGLLRASVFKSSKIAKYAKIGLRIRDYLIKFFPLEDYPVGSTGEKLLESTQPVAKAEVQKASKEFGFNIPFVKGR